MSYLKVLITGITGFAGSHMADYLLTKKNINVYGIKKWSSRIHNIKHVLNKIRLYDCDITDYTSVRNVLEIVKPDIVFHFAAQSYVKPSWDLPASTFLINVNGTLNFLEAIRHLKLNPYFHVSGSGEEYGLVYESEIPITEKNELRPLNPYAVSKCAQDLLSYEHFMSYGLKVIRTRTFNHEGPRRDKVFAIPSFSYQIARIEAALQKPEILVGNLSAKRNFTDVRDIVKAYWLTVRKCKSGELYLIGSNQIYTLEEVLTKLIKLSKIKSDIKIVTDPEKLRLTEVPLLIGKYDKFISATGWKPEISFDKTLQDILNYWRKYVKLDDYPTTT